MEGPTSLQKNWVLTQDAFDVLLARLDRDRERAGQRYEEIRRGLVTFFECRGCSSPEDHADETINRVARGLVEGKEILAENPAGYFYGVAKNVLKEYWKSPTLVAAPLEGLSSSKLVAGHPSDLQDRRADGDEAEHRLDCLEGCLEGLASKDRQLIAQYYRGEAARKIRNRKSLAAGLGVGLNALRIRALRIREKLEDCVGQCLTRSSQR